MPVLFRHGISPSIAALATLTLMSCTRTTIPSDAAAEDSVLSPMSLPVDRSFSALFGPNEHHDYFKHAEAYRFQFGATEFSRINAWWLAEASMLAYVDDRPFVESSLKRAGMKRVTFFTSGVDARHDTQAFVAHDDHAVLVVMRGTEPDSPRDLLTDLNFLQSRAGDAGAVHAGFQEALDEVWVGLRNHLEALKSNTKGDSRRFWFTGHSLGGALALLAAERFDETAGVYTFGAPRAGDVNFSRRIRERIRARVYRVVNNADLVPELPPPLFYQHAGELKYFDSRHRLIDGLGELERFSDQVRGRLEEAIRRLKAFSDLRTAFIPPKDLEDHAPIYYVTHCWNALIEEVK